MIEHLGKISGRSTIWFNVSIQHIVRHMSLIFLHLQFLPDCRFVSERDGLDLQSDPGVSLYLPCNEGMAAVADTHSHYSAERAFLETDGRAFDDHEIADFQLGQIPGREFRLSNNGRHANVRCDTDILGDLSIQIPGRSIEPLASEEGRDVL